MRLQPILEVILGASFYGKSIVLAIKITEKLYLDNDDHYTRLYRIF